MPHPTIFLGECERLKRIRKLLAMHTESHWHHDVLSLARNSAAVKLEPANQCHIHLATRPDGGPVSSCGENYHLLGKDMVKGLERWLK